MPPEQDDFQMATEDFQSARRRLDEKQGKL
jgi:hypothetical protein